MKSIIAIIIICFLSGNSSGLELRLLNGGSENFKVITIEIDNKIFRFENIAPGERTNPISINGSYHYFKTTIITDTDTISSYPVDYNGQRFYKNGKLTVKLFVEELNAKRVICFRAIQ